MYWDPSETFLIFGSLVGSHHVSDTVVRFFMHFTKCTAKKQFSYLGILKVCQSVRIYSRVSNHYSRPICRKEGAQTVQSLIYLGGRSLQLKGWAARPTRLNSTLGWRQFTVYIIFIVRLVLHKPTTSIFLDPK